MGISVIGAAASSGGGGGGGFVINTGDYSSDTAELSTEFAAGAYGITVSPSDSTLDIYLVASDGSFAGYTNTGSITATVPFDKVVVLGSTASTSLSFVFNGESQTAATKGQLTNAGAYVSSVVTSSLPSVDDTTVVNGGNFAADVAVSFIDQSAVETSAKTVVRSSSTQLLITRPDSFSPDDSPYTVKVVNPGIPVPSGSNPHLLSNSVTAGTNPVWTTGTSTYYNVGGATSFTLLATDTEATDVDYSIVSGTLPAGLALDGETGVISGTFSGSASANDATAFTFRATDTGGNFLDKAINMIANTAPTWNTTGTVYIIPGVYTYAALSASSAVAANNLTYSLVSGSVLSGTTLSNNGVFSGVNSASAGTTSTVTIRVTDPHGLYADQTLTLESGTPVSGGTFSVVGNYAYHTFTSSGTLTANANVSVEYVVVGGGGNSQGLDGGGGGGGVISGTLAATPGTYSVTVGASGGGSSSLVGAQANGGQNGGGSGGTSGVTYWNGSQIAAGNAGGYNSYGGSGSGGGGGHGAVGANMTYRWGGNGGDGHPWLNGIKYGGGGGGGTGWANFEQGYGGGYSPDGLTSGAGRSAAAPNRGGGGSANGQTGIPSYASAAGVVVVRYPA